jgi:hypothetical protein
MSDLPARNARLNEPFGQVPFPRQNPSERTFIRADDIVGLGYGRAAEIVKL